MRHRDQVVHIPLIPSLTDSQKAVLDAVVTHLVRFRESPTYREVAEAAELPYPTAYSAVQRLVQKGFLVRGGAHRMRSLQVTNQTAELYRVRERGEKKKRKEVEEFLSFATLPKA